MKSNNHRAMGDTLLSVARVLSQASTMLEKNGYVATAADLSVQHCTVVQIAEKLRHEAPPKAERTLDDLGAHMDHNIKVLMDCDISVAEAIDDVDARVTRLERFARDLCKGHPA